MAKSVVVLVDAGYQGQETAFLKEQIEQAGCKAVLADMGVVGKPTIKADVTREQIAEAGGTPLAQVAGGRRRARKRRR